MTKEVHDSIETHQKAHKMSIERERLLGCVNIRTEKHTCINLYDKNLR